MISSLMFKQKITNLVVFFSASYACLYCQSCALFRKGDTDKAALKSPTLTTSWENLNFSLRWEDFLPSLLVLEKYWAPWFRLLGLPFYN